MTQAELFVLFSILLLTAFIISLVLGIIYAEKED